MTDAGCCPNCGKHGRFDVSQEDFDEYRCGNGNCRVEVYRVHTIDTESGQGVDDK